MPDLRNIIIDELIRFRRLHRLSLIVMDSKRSSGTACFESEYPDSFIDLGVMEQTAMDVAAGLSACGETVVVMGIGTFVTMRGFEQIRTMLAHNKYNVKIFGLWSGLYYTNQGHTHTLLEDLAMMCPLPNVRVYCAGSMADVSRVTREVLSIPGPAYVRIEDPLNPREDLDGHQHDSSDAIRILRRGRDVTLAGMGWPVGVAQSAADELASQGITSTVLDIVRLKPFDEKMLLDAVRDVKAVVTIEEHRRHGGLGSIVAQILCEAGLQRKFRIISIADDFVHNLTSTEARAHYGISTENVSATICDLLQFGCPSAA
jgi:transketolase